MARINIKFIVLILAVTFNIVTARPGGYGGYGHGYASYPTSYLSYSYPSYGYGHGLYSNVYSYPSYGYGHDWFGSYW